MFTLDAVLDALNVRVIMLDDGEGLVDAVGSGKYAVACMARRKNGSAPDVPFRLLTSYHYMTLPTGFATTSIPVRGFYVSDTVGLMFCFDPARLGTQSSTLCKSAIDAASRARKASITPRSI